MSAFKKPSKAAPRAIAPLDVLPVFLSLRDKPVLVAGGSDAAAWKAELLAAAGARVHVVAADVTEVMQHVIARDNLTYIARSWTENDFSNMAVAVADLDDASAFVAAAKAFGVSVNVIDQPHYCQFQFGSIVNRSPVVIGISTSGAAPILGQAIRRRIETLLPASLSLWAQKAKEVRASVLGLLPDAKKRRAFWERFADHAFSKARPDDALEMLLQPAPTSRAGKVTLVGAGPGDAELLTLKAVRALQSADVILFDDLISDEVLDLARREAKRMLVGKRGGRTSCKQEDINALMLKLASRGKHVVRLKSGDPMIFGRAGEEIARLEAANIQVDIVSGVTSALAAAAMAKVSLTHRDHAQSVRFITGHSRKGELPDGLDWNGLADEKTTLIVYMGGRTAKSFCQALLDHGYAPQTPAICFHDVSRQGESCAATTVQQLAQFGAEMDSRPILIGIGQALSESALVRALPLSVEDAGPLVAQL